MYCTFLFNILKNRNTNLCNLFKEKKNDNDIQTRSIYVIPYFRTDFKKFSFSVISTQLLNGFIHTFVKDNKKIEFFQKFLKASVASEYRKSVRFWT